jgi:hypothetical protein
MDVTEGTKRRRKVGIRLFCERKSSVSYYDVNFIIESDRDERILSVRTFTDWQDENSNEQLAQEQIDKSKKVFAVFKKENQQFSKCVKGLPVRFQFCEDYGPGALILAEEKDGIFYWRRK